MVLEKGVTKKGKKNKRKPGEKRKSELYAFPA
jgi:hypothetical protein